MQKKDLRALRARAHHLKPVVMLGAKGLSDAVLAEIELALEHHELIKIKITGADRDIRRKLAGDIRDRTRAELVQSIGQMTVLYREKTDTER